MSAVSTGWGWFLGIAFAFSGNCALAQITPDGTLPNNSDVRLQGNTFNITGGTQAGSNLFHSFGQFSVPTRGTAFFNNAVDIQNIISRVTGGSISNIDGLIRANGTANLFLINPSGIVFGQNASLNVGGSFVASTASTLKFADNFEFSAAPQSTPLLTITVPVGLQFGVNPGSILSQSQATNSSRVPVGLQVQPGKTLALVGGEVKLDGGILQVPGGRVELGGLAEPGTVSLNGNGSNLSLSFPDAVARASVLLNNGAEVNVQARGGGSIAVNARNLDVLGGSSLIAGIGQVLGSVVSQAGDITLNATGEIKVVGEGSYVFNDVRSQAMANAGDLTINTQQLLIRDGAQVGAATFGAGKGGNLTVKADNVQLIGTSTNGQFSSGLFATQASRGATGNAGDLTINTQQLLIRDGARVDAGTSGAGKGGNLTVTSNNVQVIGRSADGRVSSRLSAQAYQGATGSAGDLTINTQQLLVRDGAQVSASTFGAGNGGNLAVKADNVQLIGISPDGQNPGGLFTTQDTQGATGNAGDLTINTQQLLIRDGAQVGAATFGAGKGGDLTVKADNVQLIGTSTNGQFSSGLFATQASRGATGNAGDLTINTQQLLIRDGARVDAGTSGAGKGGNLTVTSNNVQVIGRSADGRVSSRLSAQAYQGATGSAGDLTINTQQLLVRDGAQVSASTFGAGNGGNLTVTSDNVQVIGRFANGQFSSDLSSQADRTATGNAGNLTINTQQLLVRDGAQVSASTFGAGNGGNLAVKADNVQLIGISPDGQNPGGLFTTQDTQGATGNAGDLTINTQQLLIRDGAQVSAATFSAGKGGNLTVKADNVQLIGTSANGQFSSGLFATQASRGATGNAGDLTINTQQLLIRDGARVDAGTSGAGKGGNLTVTSNNVQVIGRSADGRVSSRLSAQAYQGATGSAGDLTINTQQLLVRDGAQVSASTFGAGNGGNLTVTSDNVQLIGISPDGQNPGGLFTTQDTQGATGNAGDLTINTQQLLIRDGAQVSAATFSAGKGGNLTVKADNVQLIGTSANGQFSSGLFATQASRGATGNAGDLTINTQQLLIRDGARVDAGTFGAGKGGNLTVTSDNVQVIGRSADGQSPSSLSTLTRGSGDAGNLTITTRQLLISDGAQTTVSSRGKGATGNLGITVSDLRLNNGKIIAQSGSGNGGNLRLHVANLLLLRRGSEISTTAGIQGTGGDGGNITINAPNGFIVAVPDENSDITANAFTGSGGRVDITASGIYGIEPRPQYSTSISTSSLPSGPSSYSKGFSSSPGLKAA